MQMEMNFAVILLSEKEGKEKEGIPDQNKTLEPGADPSLWQCEQILFLP